MQIIILGMHRSGTSVLARLLNMAGIYFGPEGISTGANIQNPKGFWERRDIRNFNDTLLFANQFDWYKISQFDISNLEEDSVKQYQKSLSQVLLSMDAYRPWFVKEPRLCLLFPLWQELLEMPICLHIYRNPLEVAFSLKTRNAIPLLTGIALWEKYTVTAFNASRGFNRILVSYNDILSDPDQALDRLIADLSAFDVKGLRRPSNKEIRSFIDERFHRNVDTSDQCWEYLNENQKMLYQALLNESILVNDREYFTSVSSQKELKQYETNLSYIDGLENELDQYKKALRQIKTKRDDLIQALCQIKTKRDKLIDEISELKDQYKREADQYDQTINSLTELLDLLFDDFRRVLNSKFWRILKYLNTVKYRLMFKSPPPMIDTHLTQLNHRYQNQMEIIRKSFQRAKPHNKKSR